MTPSQTHPGTSQQRRTVPISGVSVRQRFVRLNEMPDAQRFPGSQDDLAIPMQAWQDGRLERHGWINLHRLSDAMHNAGMCLSVEFRDGPVLDCRVL